MKENPFVRGVKRIVESVEDVIDGARAESLGKEMGNEAVRTQKLMAEINKISPPEKQPMDPALRALLEEKVAQGRMTPEAFEAELAKYRSDSSSQDSN